MMLNIKLKSCKYETKSLETSLLDVYISIFLLRIYSNLFVKYVQTNYFILSILYNCPVNMLLQKKTHFSVYYLRSFTSFVSL